MEFINWIPALSTTGLLAAALWLSREVLATRLKNSVKHEFNRKIVELEGEIRKTEEQFKSELATKSDEIAALRSGALTALASRQEAVERRRLEAVDQLWEATVALAPTRRLSSWMAVIKFKGAATEAKHKPELRQFFEAIGNGFDSQSLDNSSAEKSRPFVSAMAWANYSAMHAVVSHAFIRWKALSSGLDEDISDTESINGLLKTALPHQAEYVDEYGPEGYHLLLEKLEGALLGELRSMLVGGEMAQENIEQAAEIVRQANEIHQKTQQSAAADPHSASLQAGG